MKFYIGITDTNWYNYISRINPEDLNFWKPGENSSFKVLSPGEPFLFKLKSPYNAISGMGFFTCFSKLPINIAWDTFGNRNGCENFTEFKALISKYRFNSNFFVDNSLIGCVILTNPIFFKSEDWIEIPENWSKSIVQG